MFAWLRQPHGNEAREWLLKQEQRLFVLRFEALWVAGFRAEGLGFRV